MPETNNIRDNNMENWMPWGAPAVPWTDPELARIVRWRFVTDVGFPFWDESYCWGELKDGTRVRVGTGLFQTPRKNFREALVARAKSDGVYLKGLGVFNGGVISQLS